MSNQKRTVLITGCSEGGMGAALAVAFHEAGLRVYATARNPDKMQHLVDLGIKTLTLDVLSDSSIKSCLAQLSSLDILVNNAGSQFLMPVVDTNITKAKELYDLNVWSHIAMTQAFLPLLLKSPDAMIVNQTSIGSVIALPFQAVYNSSKAAFAMFSDTMRLELQPFGIKVIELKTGIVQTKLIANIQRSEHPRLPDSSIYEPAREIIEKSLRQEGFDGEGLSASQWAKSIVQDVTKKNPPAVIWRGHSASLTRLSSVLPHGMFDGTVKKLSGLEAAEQIIKKSRGD